MATMTVEISGAFTLAQIESAIKFEEVACKEFISSEVRDNYNLVAFKNRELGEIPKVPMLTLSSAPAPIGSAKIWEGIMFVGGKTVKVTVSRKQD